MSLSVQFFLSVDYPISVVLMRQMDSLPLTIHHLPHQNVPLPPSHQWKIAMLFPKKIKVVYCVISFITRSYWSFWAKKVLFYFVSNLLWSLTKHKEEWRELHQYISSRVINKNKKNLLYNWSHCKTIIHDLIIIMFRLD